MISIIIPTLNEAGSIAATLGAIRAQGVAHEILVVDAGSSDATIQLVKHGGAKVIDSTKRQRAFQMNLGASQATGDILLFLHADTQLPAGGLARIEEIMADGVGSRPAVAGGGFARRFDSQSLFLRFTCGLATWRCRCFGWFLGDQAIFVRTSIFQSLGGYREMDIFEDVDFSRRLVRAGRVMTLRPGVISSARRFERRGALLTTLRDFWLTCRYLAGVKIK